MLTKKYIIPRNTFPDTEETLLRVQNKGNAWAKDTITISVALLIIRSRALKFLPTGYRFSSKNKSKSFLCENKNRIKADMYYLVFNSIEEQPS